jgi:hypothetical protein
VIVFTDKLPSLDGEISLISGTFDDGSIAREAAKV